MHHSGSLLVKVDFHKNLLRLSVSDTADISILWSDLSIVSFQFVLSLS